MSDESKGRAAIDRITKDIKDHAERGGRQVTDDAARKQAREIAERAERKVIKK